MKLKILKNIFIAVFVVFLATSVTVFSAMYIYYKNADKEELDESAKYIAAAVDANGTEWLKNIENDGVSGVEIIDKDGKTFYQIGAQTQNSTYGSAETQYGELRIYKNQENVGTLFVNLFYQAVIIITLAIIVCIVIASRVAKSITEPMNKIDLENPNDRGIYPELKPFVQKIYSQNKKIHRQMEEIRNQHESKDRLRREFTANVSHELKTPLTSIAGTAEIIRDGLVKPEDIPHFADNIHKESGRLMRLVEDIIKLSRLEESGAEDEEKIVVSLKTLAQDSAAILSQAAQKAQVSLEVSGDDGYIFAVERIAEEIVFNLLDNAIKYNRPNGTVKATIETKSEKVLFSVRDSGIGIPEKELERIFERFYRVDKSRSKSVGGTGLGLSIVKHGVNSLGAEIDIKSELGFGTEITVLFQCNITNR